MNKHQFVIVDLDETLIKTDLLYEMIFQFIKNNPLKIFQIVGWLLSGGKLGLKNQLSRVVSPKVELLPYRIEVLNHIKEAKTKGQKIGLVSASPQKWVDRVAGYLGLFDFSIGSTGRNLKGLAKHEMIQSHIGSDKYQYIGDSSCDLEIWIRCKNAVGVNLSRSVKERLHNKGIPSIFIDDRTQNMKVKLKQLRIHQWAKNALLFLPILAAHQIGIDSLLKVAIAFCSFSFAASSVYILNDLIDIESDRNHHSKKNRPLAAGTLSIKSAIYLLITTVIVSIIAALVLNPAVLMVVLSYYFLNLIYTFYFKKEIVLDIILLSGMYTIRLFAGAAAASVVISSWLLSFSTLFFFSLACVKRFTELARSQSKPTIDGRGYRGLDQQAVFTLGVGSGLLSILVVLFYIQSGDTNLLYSKKQNLWLITPILLYWLGRLWLLAGRNEINDDPVVFAIKDKKSWFAGIAFVVTLLMAI